MSRREPIPFPRVYGSAPNVSSKRLPPNFSLQGRGEAIVASPRLSRIRSTASEDLFVPIGYVRFLKHLSCDACLAYKDVDREGLGELMRKRVCVILGQTYTVSYTLNSFGRKSVGKSDGYGSHRLTQNQVSSRKCWFESDRGHQP